MKSNTNPNETENKKCFSYIRYSSKIQKLGSSEARQLEIAPRVASEKGWILNENLNVQSLGISAYSGSNVKTIKGIIKAANDGIIEIGTVCIIEALDRYTRLPLDNAYQLLREMLIAGIEIYTDKNQRHLTKADLNNPMSVTLTIVELSSGFEFSDKLSNRVRTAYKEKHIKILNGNKTTRFGKLPRNVPKWINPSTWQLIPEFVSVVQSIFEMYNNGLGVYAIAKNLNGKNLKTFGYGKCWSGRYIGYLLQSPTVIGEYHPRTCERKPETNYYVKTETGEVFKNYYPAAITEDLFYTVQSKHETKTGNRKKAVRTSKEVKNIFAGIAKCNCGASMNLVTGSSKHYYTCGNRPNGICNQPTIQYTPFEKVFADIISTQMQLFLTKPENNEKSIAVINGQIASIRTQIDNITQFVIEGRATKALVAKQNELESELDKLIKELKVLSIKEPVSSFSREDIKSLRHNLTNFKTDYALRTKVKDFCITQLKSITFDGMNKTMTIEAKRNTLKVVLSDDYSNFTIKGNTWKVKNYDEYGQLKVS